MVHAVGTIQLVGEFLDFLGAVLSLGQVQREPEVSAADFGSLIKQINLGRLLIHGFQRRAQISKQLSVIPELWCLLLLHSRERRLSGQVHGLVVGRRRLLLPKLSNQRGKGLLRILVYRTLGVVIGSRFELIILLLNS